MSSIRQICYILVILNIGSKLFGQSANFQYSFPAFNNYQVESDINYGKSIGANDSTINLLLDFYTGTGDTTRNRPLIIFIHGGGFRNGNKFLKMNALFCSHFARFGYAAASIQYRLTKVMKSNDEYFLAMIRAVQDAKAAVRFFRKNAVKFRIDTSKIFVMGSSAGAITALHLAYLDQSEIPASIDLTALGSLDGNSGNPGYSSTVSGVINCWGAIGDYRWIQKGDAPIFSIHGVNDSTIAYDSSFSYKAFKYGSVIINNRAKNVGINSDIRLFYLTGHTLDSDSTKLEFAANDITNWISQIVIKK